MSSPTLHTLLTLPTEVLERILPHLSQPDLDVCVRVSRSWNKALLPYLWRTPNVRSHGQLSKFATDEALQALRRNAVYVRDLHIVCEQQYNQLLPARQTLISDLSVIPTGDFAIGLFRNLDSLELHDVNFRDPKTELSQEILALVRRNPLLRLISTWIRAL
jgi:hypothetical protein